MSSSPPTSPAVQHKETPSSSPSSPSPPSLATSINSQVPPTQQISDSQPTYSLSRLSPELREKIWLFTFEPRTIHLKFHTGKTPSMTAQAHLPWVTDQPLKTACIVITASVYPTPSKPSNQPWKTGDYRNWTFTEQMKARVPRGPVALYVCAESRAIAMKRYQRAFAGTNCVPEQAEFAKVWRETGYGEKRVWVDFERDVIFLEMDWVLEHLATGAGPAGTGAWPAVMGAGADQTLPPQPQGLFRPAMMAMGGAQMQQQHAIGNRLIQPKALGTLATYAKEETRKINRFAMDGKWGFTPFRPSMQHIQSSPAQFVGNHPWNGTGTGTGPGTGSNRIPLDLRNFKDFEKLEELFICDAFQDRQRRSMLGFYNDDNNGGGVGHQSVIREVVTSWELSKEKLGGGGMEREMLSIRVMGCLGQVKGCPGCGVTHPRSYDKVSHRVI